MSIEELRKSLAALPADDKSEDYKLKDGTCIKRAKRNQMGALKCSISMTSTGTNSAWEAKMAGILQSR